MRTLEQFIKDARQRGRTREEVRGIALNTQWSNRTREALEEYDRQTIQKAA